MKRGIVLMLLACVLSLDTVSSHLRDAPDLFEAPFEGGNLWDFGISMYS